jgi:hypothetical protein
LDWEKNQPITRNQWIYGNDNPAIFSDPSGHIAITEVEEAEEIIKEMRLSNIKIIPDWGFNNIELKSATICGWVPGIWRIYELRQIRNSIHLINNGLGIFGTTLTDKIDKLAVRRTAIPDRKGHYRSSAGFGIIKINEKPTDIEIDKFSISKTMLHETGHQITHHDGKTMDYFMEMLKAKCTNGIFEYGTIFCNQENKEGHNIGTYDPGPYAGLLNEHLPSYYAALGNFEDFAETFVVVIAGAGVLASNDPLELELARYIYYGSVTASDGAEYQCQYNNDIAERRIVMWDILNGLWRNKNV